jgi:signal transduction histidine kinase
MQSERQTDVWQKWDWVWQAIFYITIFASITLLISRNTPLWTAGLLTTLWLGWHWVGLKLAYKNIASWEHKAGRRLVILIGDIIIWFILVNISPVFYIALYGLFVQVFRNLPTRYAIIAVILIIIATLVEQLMDATTPFALTNPATLLFFLMVFASVIMAVWISAIIQQSDQRRLLIEQLEATQAELAAAERREGVLEERQRLAREIHDTLAQGFTSIVMHLEAADQALPTDPNTLQKHLDQARTTARHSLDQARRVVQDLRPDLLEQNSLPDAIKRTASRWQDETNIPVTTTTTGNLLPLHPNIEVTLLRATQEALSNIRKHAQATAVQLTLSYFGDVVMLDVQDNGVGLHNAKPSSLSSGYGLQAMQERAAQWGGSVDIESDPDDGTTVTVAIPISDGNQ